MRTESTEPNENVGTKLLFENERVRVWDLALAPGEALEKHVHRNDFLFIVVSGGSLRHVDPDNSANDRDVRYHDDQVVFVEAEDKDGGIVHNRLVNVGDSPYRNFVIELKGQHPAKEVAP
jgi:mannose-6-phosphate isomerase-like protein (cupin superfamily)